jgi:hypothetical protein
MTKADLKDLLVMGESTFSETKRMVDAIVAPPPIASREVAEHLAALAAPPHAAVSVGLSHHDHLFSLAPEEAAALRAIIKENAAAAKAEIVNVNTVNGKESYTLNSNSKTLKDYIKRTVPSITYGTPTSVMSSFSVQSIDMQDFETVLLIQATNGTRVPGQQQLNSPQNDMQIYPMNFSASIFGCPLIDYAQEFFIDMSTGTSLDNIYVVNGISHKLTQGSFKTDLELKLTRTTSAASAIDSKIRTLLANIDKKTAGTPAT